MSEQRSSSRRIGSRSRSSRKNSTSGTIPSCGAANDSSNNNTSGAMGAATPNLWDLPHILLYLVGQFAVMPTERASWFCHIIAPLCKASYRSILVDDAASVGLWDLILAGDYGVAAGTGNNSTGGTTHSPNGGVGEPRHSKRLKKSPAHRVGDAHRRMIANTELAYSDLWELGYSSAPSGGKRKGAGRLTKPTLVAILKEYEPVMVNRRMASGGTFLVEVCRSRNSPPGVVLKCVRELVEVRGARPDLATYESKNSSLTALCVAAVRGLPRVVAYLLSRKDASPSIRCSGRFRLHTNPKRSLRCTDATPLEFAERMLATETGEGATQRDLRDLNRCVRLLRNAAAAANPTTTAASD